MGVDRADKVVIHSGSIGAGVDDGMQEVMNSCPWIADHRPPWHVTYNGAEIHPDGKRPAALDGTRPVILVNDKLVVTGT